MKSIYFDLDDTLVYTQYKFNQAAIDCLQEINNFFGVDNPHPKMVIDHFIALELDNAQQFGFKKVRFANSWVNTYRFFVDRLDYKYDEDMEKRLWDIANKVNEPPFIVVDGAPEAIIKIRNEVKEIFVLTMGDPEIQNQKIKALPEEMVSCFDDIFVLPKKNPEAFRETIGERNPKDCIMVGNSARSDILPAIKNGAYAIHIPVETWMYDLHEEPFYYNKLYSIPSIKQLPTILRAIEEE